MVVVRRQVSLGKSKNIETLTWELGKKKLVSDKAALGLA